MSTRRQPGGGQPGMGGDEPEELEKLFLSLA
ncbi:hypothetical protein BJ960_001254 [Leucobacter aridicollis]|uniref:Uncharacterized protein n=1 Tax=Leucobacter aridicollis TaxID=283878 RepID=A0A852QYM3_9MICO|nr:hypothetical protein [Leucobacter aridicollis]